MPHDHARLPHYVAADRNVTVLYRHSADSDPDKWQELLDAKDIGRAFAQELNAKIPLPEGWRFLLSFTAILDEPISLFALRDDGHWVSVNFDERPNHFRVSESGDFADRQTLARAAFALRDAVAPLKTPVQEKQEGVVIQFPTRLGPTFHPVVGP